MTTCDPRKGSALARLGALGLALSLLAVHAATPVQLPYLQNVRTDRATILFSTRENLPATVQYSTDQSYSQSVNTVMRPFPASTTGMSISFYQYQADLTGLSPGTQYFYRVMVGGQNISPESDYKFHTAGTGPFTFLVFGDSGAATPAQTAVTLRLVAETPDFVIQVGDIAYEDGTFQQFQDNFFGYYFSLLRRAPFFMIPGNHEYYTNNAAPFLALTSSPTETVPAADRGRYYSFDWGAVHFVGLDSNLLPDPIASKRMLQWLDADLTQAIAPWRVAFFHHLPYPVSQHIDDPVCIAARNTLVPILEQHGVQLVLSGHEHSYMRSKPLRAGTPVQSGLGTIYMTTGGGGGVPHPTYPEPFLAAEAGQYHYLRIDAGASQITVKAIGTDGVDFDRVTLSLPALASNSVVNAASFTQSLAPGELVSIFGQGLANGTSSAAVLPLPNDLAGASVTLNGAPMPLVYASPGQINAQLPIGIVGTGVIRVTTSAGFAEAPVSISDTAPAIFASGILHADYGAVTSARPARPGETLVVFLTGLGGVDGAIDTGQPAPFSPFLPVLAPVQMQVGSTSAPAIAGLAPGFVGLYQLNFVVPDLPTQTYAARVSAKGNLSNTMQIPVLGK